MLKLKNRFHLLTIWIMLFVTTCCFLANGLAMADTDTQQAEVIPWSGYWWPYQSGGLATGTDYRGLPAPLQKYELLVNGATSGPSIDSYNERYHDPTSPPWYGLCGYWAQASAFENIDFFPSSENNIIFRVGDKKGLLTLAHDDNLIESAEGKYPEIFHYWLLNFIKDQKKAFVADLDPGIEVWSYPIYRYEMNQAVRSDRISVAVTIYYADDFVSPDYVGTQVQFKKLTYDLFLEGDKIVSGQWTDDSVNDHPDRLTFPVSEGTSVDGLDYEKVLELAKSKDDFLEAGNESVSISPGTYNLILMDGDRYRIDCQNGEIVKIGIEKQPGGAADFNVMITDGIGSKVVETTVGEEMPFSFSVIGEMPPYTVIVTQVDYSDPNIYTLKFDLMKNYCQLVPYIPKNGMWSGFAITNPSEKIVGGVMLVAYDEAGDPIQTVYGPTTLQAGERRIFLFESLPWRQHAYLDMEKLFLMADASIGNVSMVGNVNPDVAACFVQGNAISNHLVIPDTVSPFSPNKSMIGSVTNESINDASFSISLYNAEGYLSKEVQTTLTSRESYPLIPGAFPFYTMPDNGWIDIAADGLESTLSGYQFIRGAGSAEGLFALPVGSIEKIIPHVPPAGGNWEASATLINPTDQENELTLHPAKAGNSTQYDVVVSLFPHEKRTIDLLPDFGRKEGDDLYHSVIEISGRFPFVGYYTYRPVGQTETACYPLFEAAEGKKELVLSHNAGEKSNWWTAACIFNTTMVPVTVEVQPYDEFGAMMTALSGEFSLAAGAYDAFFLQHYFGRVAADRISFIKFTVKDGVGNIGGFYLYGGLTGQMISGANM